MTQCDLNPTGPTGRGRGTAKTHFSSPDRIKSKEDRNEDLIGGDSETGELAVPRPLSAADDLEHFLADNPAMSPRDHKGKGFHAFSPFDKHRVLTGERPWHELDRDEVRRLATSEKARFLTRSQRMAAGRDPGLIWCERSRTYRLRDEATPAPSPVAGQSEG